MKIKFIILSLIFCYTTLLAEDISFFKNYYPKKPYIYFFNDELTEVKTINDGRFGIKEELYTIEKTGQNLLISNSDKERFEVVIAGDNISGKMYDNQGLWQTYSINKKNGRLLNYLWTYRLMVEGQDEPLMIEEDNIFLHEKLKLVEHRRPSQNRSRIYFYNGSKLDKVQNFLGNGEEVKEVFDIYKYSNDTDYIVSPCSELSFYSIHYPIMDKKIHTEELVDGILVVKDTYYHNNKIYFEYTEKWNEEKVISLKTYIGVRNHTTIMLFKY